jgi:protein gp37
MSDTTKISWTDHTWNPWHGCTKISPGCAHCYMYTAKERYGQDPSIVRRSKSTFRDPLRWEEEAEAKGVKQRVFTCSWSDFFHETADPWRAEAWEIIRRCPNLHFQILTKRPERIANQLPGKTPRNLDAIDMAAAVTDLTFTRRTWPWDNVWLGTSVENPKYLWRIEELLKIPARVHYISAEPLLAPLDLSPYIKGLDWVIVGGESGPGFRPMDHAWARDIRDQCLAAGVAFFFKQSSAPRTEMGTTLDGREWKEYPL